jgi:radical SAM superfamily enzyme YgiQ (UPF0313 family)
VFPLGLVHLNSALRKAGHSTRWVDLQMAGPPLEQVLGDFRPDLVGISLRNIDDVLIRKRETYYDDLPRLCHMIHTVANCPVVLGGSGFSIFPRELLELSGADFGVCGPGETALLQLLESLADPAATSRIPGLAYRQGDEIIVSPQGHAPTADLAESDWPTAVVQHYLSTGGMLNLQTQRGCAFHCCYCTYPIIEGRSHRRQNAEAVAEEFAQLARLGAKYAFIVDSVFNSSPRHVAEICEAIIRRNLKISWGCFLRPQGLTVELMQLMAKAGLSHAEFGTDSLCDEVLTEYRKGFTFDDVLRSSDYARQAKVDYCHFLIVGGPGETEETLRTSHRNSRLLDGAVFMAVVGMRIYPGTTLYGRAVAEGTIERDTDLLKPRYYIAQGFNTEALFARLRDFSTVSPNWIVGDPSPEYSRLVQRLRQRGVPGPLWSYFSLLQRFSPMGAVSAKPTTASA